MGKHNNSSKLKKLELLPEEKAKYIQIGEVDPNQDWLEFFTPTVVEDLFTIMDSCSDNDQKSEYIQEELTKYKFEVTGQGTNILTMHNMAYPGVVFKIALDRYGLADNYNDEILEPMVNKILGQNRFTHVLARHPTGIVSVQERKVLIRTQLRMQPFLDSIMSAIEKLAEEFLIIDLAPTVYQLNYGIDRNGDWCFLDASDLYPKSQVPKEYTRCRKPVSSNSKTGKIIRCGGALRYSDDYAKVICRKCNDESGPAVLRPNDKTEVAKKMLASTMDGFSTDEIKEMEAAELKVRLNKRSSAAPTKTRVETVIIPESQVEEDPEEELTVSSPEFEEDLATHGHTVIRNVLAPEEQSSFEISDEDDEEDEEPVPEEIEEEPVPEVKPEPEPATTNIRSIGDPPKPRRSLFGPPKEVKPENPPAIVEIDEGDEEPEEKPEELPVAESAEEFTEEPVVEHQPEEDCGIEYSFFADGEVKGILMKVKGDFAKAYEKDGLGIWISIDDGNTMTQAAPANGLAPIFVEAIDDLYEEAGLGRYPQSVDDDDEE